MTYRNMMIDNEENLSWCKPLSFMDGKIVIALHEGTIDSMIIDGTEVDANDENIQNAARLANSSYDCYKGWDDTHILIDAESEELPCRRCPWFDVCAAMDEIIEET